MAGISARIRHVLKDAVRRRFDVLMVWSIDRLGRSVLHVANALAELDAAGVALYSDQQAIDSTTPMGRAMIQMASVFGEQERQIIRSRVLAGLDRVRQQGKKLGRPNVVADGSDCQRNNAGWAITHLGRRISVNTHDAVATSTAMATMLPEPLAVLALDPAPYEIGASGRPQRCGIGTSHGPASVAASSPTC